MELHTTVHDRVNMLITNWSKFGFQDKIRTVNSKEYTSKALILLLNIFRNYSVEKFNLRVFLEGTRKNRMPVVDSNCYCIPICLYQFPCSY